MNKWLSVWWRNYKVWRTMLLPSLLARFGEPILYLLALGYGLGRYIEEIGDLPYVVFLAGGIVCSGCIMTASFEGLYSAYTRMAVQKTWDAMLSTPLRLNDILMGELIWAATKSVISVAAILLVAVALDLVSGWQAILILPVSFLAGLCFGALALVVTALVSDYEMFFYYTTLILTPMILFSGVYFPMTSMPVPFQMVFNALPLAHLVDVVRPLMTGGVVSSPFLHLFVMAAYGIVAYFIAAVLIKRRIMD